MAKENKKMESKEESAASAKAPEKKGAAWKGGKAEKISDLPAFKNDADMSNPGMLASRLDHSVMISYDGQAMMIPPRARVKIGNCEKLGALPVGIQLIRD